MCEIFTTAFQYNWFQMQNRKCVSRNIFHLIITTQWHSNIILFLKTPKQAMCNEQQEHDHVVASLNKTASFEIMVFFNFCESRAQIHWQILGKRENEWQIIHDRNHFGIDYCISCNSTFYIQSCYCGQKSFNLIENI